jgi:hypothetical protein
VQNEITEVARITIMGGGLLKTLTLHSPEMTEDNYENAEDG